MAPPRIGVSVMPLDKIKRTLAAFAPMLKSPLSEPEVERRNAGRW